MAKRRLSRRQIERIRALRANARPDTGGREDGLGPEQEGRIIAHHGRSLVVEDGEGRLHHCWVRQNLGALACGDRVRFRADGRGGGVVEARLPRDSLLARFDERGRERPIAANIDRIVVVSAVVPEMDEFLVDRYLVVAENTGIPAALVLNKIDLADETTLAALDARLQVYRRLDYPVVLSSRESRHGLDELKALLTGHSSILVGQSGVGKSSLINALVPDLEIRVGELTPARHGRHTTSSTMLYHLPFGGEIFDSPGVRDFALWQVDRRQIERGFREFRPLPGRCRFRDCTHLREPGCAVREAVERGEIAARRFESYRRMVEEMAERSG